MIRPASSRPAVGDLLSKAAGFPALMVRLLDRVLLAAGVLTALRDAMSNVSLEVETFKAKQASTAPTSEV